VVTVAVYLFFLACLMGRQLPGTPCSYTCIAGVFFMACLMGRVSRHTWLIYLYC